MTFPKVGRRCSSGDFLAEGATEAGASSLKSSVENGAAADATPGNLWRRDGRWTFNVNHRHGIFEGNTMLNFAGER